MIGEAWMFSPKGARQSPDLIFPPILSILRILSKDLCSKANISCNKTFPLG